jgi:hypothetical protein
MLLTRQLSKTTIDSHYATKKYQIMKQWVIAHADKVIHICADDKLTVPVTAPGVYCGAVPRQRRVIAAQEMTLSVGNHDFFMFQLTPPLHFLVDMP